MPRALNATEHYLYEFKDLWTVFDTSHTMILVGYKQLNDLKDRIFKIA